MFSGIIRETGVINSRGRNFIKVAMTVNGVKTGDSIAVNGVCLTAAEIKRNEVKFDVSDKTMALSNLPEALKVNIERALKPSDDISGHFVTGHVDGVALLVKIEKTSGFAKYYFRVPEELLKYVAVRGAVALNGVSLTVENVKGNVFSVNVIPETLRRTNFAGMKKGGRVNFEADIFARYVVNYFEMKNTGVGLTKEKLEKWL